MRQVNNLAVATHEIQAKEYVLIEHPAFPSPFRECRVKGSDAITVHWKQAEILKQKQSPGVWHVLTPPGVRVAPNECAQVCVVVEKVCRFADTKTWTTKRGAKNLRLTVSLNDKSLYEALEFTVDQSHRLDLKKTDSSEVESQLAQEWRLDSAVFPNQGIILHWRRRPEPHA